MSGAKRNYRPLFVLSIATYALLAATGALHSIRTFGHPPAIAMHYSAYVDQLLAEGDTRGAIAQLRLAIEIDVLNSEAAGALVRLARSAGDLDSEIFALRGIHRRNPLDVDAHIAVAEALLRRQPPGRDDAQQVVQHAEIVLRLDPSSSAAHRQLARAWQTLGQEERARDHRREAQRLEAPRASATP